MRLCNELVLHESVASGGLSRGSNPLFVVRQAAREVIDIATEVELQGRNKQISGVISR